MTLKIFSVPDFLNQFSKFDKQLFIRINVIEVQTFHIIKQTVISEWFNSAESLDCHINIVCCFQIV
jgi:hypothetical protein